MSLYSVWLSENKRMVSPPLAVDRVFLPQKFIDKIIIFLLRCWTETRVRWRCCHPINVCCTPGMSRQQNAPSCGMCTAARNPATQHSSTRYSGHSQCCWVFHMVLPLWATVDTVMKVGIVLILYDAPRPVFKCTIAFFSVFVSQWLTCMCGWT